MSRDQQKQKGGRGGQQGGGGQKPGQRQQAEVDKKRKRCRKGPSPRMSRRKKIVFDSFGTLMQWTNDQMSSAAS